VLVASLVPPPLVPPPKPQPEILGSLDTDLADVAAPPLKALSEYVGTNQNDGLRDRLHLGRGSPPVMSWRALDATEINARTIRGTRSHMLAWKSI
jgi:hypothetical protein